MHHIHSRSRDFATQAKAAVFFCGYLDVKYLMNKLIRSAVLALLLVPTMAVAQDFAKGGALLITPRQTERTGPTEAEH